MRANDFIKQAEKCRTDKDAEALCEKLQSAFLATPEFCGFSADNAESYMEGETPHLHFEMNYAISNVYILAVEPIIRESQLSIGIALQFMNDGLGLHSRSWTTKDEEVIEVGKDSDITIEALAQDALQLAFDFHTKLAEESGLGFTHDAARAAVEAAWAKKSYLQKNNR